ncbi:MAG: hypothetical protein U0105_22510 [Candidatus Obscuribacterales bacterium]
MPTSATTGDGTAAAWRNMYEPRYEGGLLITEEATFQPGLKVRKPQADSRPPRWERRRRERDRTIARRQSRDAARLLKTAAHDEWQSQWLRRHQE